MNIQRRRAGAEDGTLVVEATLVMPLILVLFLLLLQYGLWMFANIAVDQAAQHAARSIAIQGEFLEGEQVTSVADSSAMSVLMATNGVHNPRVAAVVDGDRRNGSVIVEAQPVRVLPLFDVPVRATKNTAIERFVDFSERS